jgi:REP element-mobilizing transposase RayT
MVFRSDDNYRFFIRKTRKLVWPVCNILAWCLMPNHFHFLLQTTGKAADFIGEAHRPATQLLAKNLGTLLSSYTQAINKRHKRRGKLFAHNTKALQITHRGNAYLANCFHYIHRNPLEAGLVKKIEDWEYSSYRDHVGLRKGGMCNLELAREILDVPSLEPLPVDLEDMKGGALYR